MPYLGWATSAGPDVHSHTLPAMSSTPKGLLESGCVPTAQGPALRASPPYVAKVHASSGPSSPLPVGTWRSSAPRAARSHSRSVHSRAPGSLPERESHSVKRSPSSRLTPLTGNRDQSTHEPTPLQYGSPAAS